MRRVSIPHTRLRLHDFDKTLVGNLHFKNVRTVAAILDQHEQLIREIDAVIDGKPTLATKYQEIYDTKRRAFRVTLNAALHIPER